MASLNHRGSVANTAIWSCALLAIVALTVWKFEIWPISWVTTETGTLASNTPDAERFAVAPIEVAAPLEEPTVQIEPTGGHEDSAARPAELAALNLESSVPIAPDRAPSKWASEPGRLPTAGNARPLGSDQPRALPTGTDFGATGRFPDASTPPPSPPAQTEPNPLPQDASLVVPTGSEASGNNGINATTTASPAPQTVAEAAPTGVTPVAAVSTTQNTVSDARLAIIDADIAENRFLAAHKALSKLYWDEPTLRPVIQSRIDKTATSIYFDAQPHYMTPYTIQPGDQLRLLARPYNVPWEYLARLNQIDDPSHIRDGQNLKVIKGPFSAVVDLDAFTLTIHAHGYYVRSYPVGVGKDSGTPIGVFKVVLKESNPKYWGQDGVVMERDDPANPLGERWLGLDDGEGNPTSYGIHGTIDPGSVGKAESRGCVRLRNEDVAELYDLLGVGSEVVIQR